MNFGVLTKTARPSSITSVQVRRCVDRPKRESGAICHCGGASNPELPRNCRRRVPLQVATGLCASKLGKAEKDHDPRARRPAWTTSSFRRAGRACGAVFRCGERGDLRGGRGLVFAVFCGRPPLWGGGKVCGFFRRVLFCFGCRARSVPPRACGGCAVPAAVEPIAIEGAAR